MGVLVPPLPQPPPHTHAPFAAPRTLPRPVAAASASPSGGAQRGPASLGPSRVPCGKDPPVCYGLKPPHMTPATCPARGQAPYQPGGSVPVQGFPAYPGQAAEGRQGSPSSTVHLHRSAGRGPRAVTTCPEGGGFPVSLVTHGAARVPLPLLSQAPPGPAAPTCAPRTLQHPDTSLRTKDRPDTATDTGRPLLPRTLDAAEDMSEAARPREEAHSIPATPQGAVATHAPSQAPRRSSQPPGPLKPLRLRLVLVLLLLTVSRAEGELPPVCVCVLVL